MSEVGSLNFTQHIVTNTMASRFRRKDDTLNPMTPPLIIDATNWQYPREIIDRG